MRDGDGRLTPAESTLPSAGRDPTRIGEYGVAAAGAIAFVWIMVLLTNALPSKWNPPMYMDIARYGVLHNDHLMAPYAYRPAMPLLVRALSDASTMPLEETFRWVTRFMASAFVFSAFVLARSFTDSMAKAMIPALTVGLSAMHVKFPLFAPTSVEVAAFPLIVLATWAFVRRRVWGCFLISALGLFFKEFLAIPLLLALRELARMCRRAPNRRHLIGLGGACAIAAAVVLVPRVGLHVVATEQEVDPLHDPRTLARLALNPLDLWRDINILVSAAGYWLPTLLLLTRRRWQDLSRPLSPLRGFIAGFLGLNFLLVMYGGTNIVIFVSYSVPIQVIVLAALTRAGVRPAEWVLVLACTILYNRALWTIPAPEQDLQTLLDALIDFYGGWDSRVNLSTLRRAAEIGAYVLAMLALRRLLFARRGRDAQAA